MRARRRIYYQCEEINTRIHVAMCICKSIRIEIYTASFYPKMDIHCRELRFALGACTACYALHAVISRTRYDARISAVGVLCRRYLILCAAAKAKTRRWIPNPMPMVWDFLTRGYSCAVGTQSSRRCSSPEPWLCSGAGETGTVTLPRFSVRTRAFSFEEVK